MARYVAGEGWSYKSAFLIGQPVRGLDPLDTAVLISGIDRLAWPCVDRDCPDRQSGMAFSTLGCGGCDYFNQARNERQAFGIVGRVPREARLPTLPHIPNRFNGTP